MTPSGAGAEQEDVSPPQPDGPGTERPSRLRRLAGRMPRWTIAFILVAAFVAAELGCTKLDWDYNTGTYSVAGLLPLVMIFLAGAIQRWNWRHAIVLLVFLAAALGVEEILDSVGLMSFEGWNPYRSLLGLSVLFCMLAMAEMLATGRRSLRVALWLLVAAVAATAVRHVAFCWVDWTAVMVKIETGSGNASYRPLQAFLYWPTVALSGWSVLGLAFAALRRGRRARIIVSGAFAAVLASHALFFSHLAFTLSETSVAGHGPFSRRNGAILLELRGRDEDFDLILDQLCQPGPKHVVSYPGYDWRETAITILSRHESVAPKAARRLAELLLRKRSAELAAHAAGLLAAERRVEVVPMMLRYALHPLGSDSHIDALVEFRVPEAALAILFRERAWRPRRKAASDGDDFEVSYECHGRLKKVLGRDVGTSYVAWEQAAIKAVDKEPSRLDKAIQDEIDREMDSYVRRLEVLRRWQEARGLLMRRRLVAAGEIGVFKTILKYEKKLGGMYAEYLVPSDLMECGATMEKFYNAAMKDLTVPMPDVDAPTVEAYEEEVELYAKRVDAVILKYIGEDKKEPTVPVKQVPVR